MKLIGLTGGIASGKSTVVRFLRQLGAEVVDADVLARQVVELGAEAYHGVVAAFGRDILCPDLSIDRKVLGSKVFGKPTALQLLGSLIHPAVRHRMEFAVADARGRGARALVQDVPLLIENSLHQQVDLVWVVYVDRETQIQRLIARDGFRRADAEARVGSQLPLADKCRHAHAVIDNGGSLAETEARVRSLWTQVMAGEGGA